MGDLGALEPVLSRTKRRVRLGRAWASLGWAAVVGLAAAALHAALARFGGMAPSLALELLSFATALLVTCIAALCVPVRDEEAAAKLDQAHALHDRVRSAVEFARIEPSARTAFMQAAVRDAVSRAAELSPKRAAPLSRPRALAWTLAPLAVWIALVAWPAAPHEAQSMKAVTRARAIDDDELAAFREELAALEHTPSLTPEASAEVRAYNALLERIATGELDESEALAALIALEHELMKDEQKPSEVDAAMLRELARDLARADEALSKALAAEDASAASEAMKKLAERMAKDELAKAQREELSRALDEIRKREQRASDDQAKAAELERLLKDKEKHEPQDPGERSLFEKKKRELERLRRDLAEQSKRHRELSRLSRDLSDASAAMAEHENQGAAESMRRGAEDLSRFGQDKLTQQQREQLQKQIQQLRESMQRQGAGQKPRYGDQQQGEDRASRTQRFVLRAQGKDPDAESSKLVMRMPGKQGQGGGQDGQGNEQGKQQPGQGDAKDEGEGEQGEQRGEGGRGEGAQALELGGDQPANAEIELPGMGTTLVQTQGAGQEHDTRTLSSPTDLDARHEDSRLAGSPGKGPTRSQVILDAADRGFATASYRKVYTDYRAHAEDVLESEDVPPGYRFYVRRYFQLIRPRDSRETP